MDSDVLKKIITDCKTKAEKENYMSYDIFDALTCNWVDKLTSGSPLLRRVAIQLNAKSPIDLHWLGMKRMQHTKAISDMLWLNCLMPEDLETSKNQEELFRLLLERRINGNFVWGLNFPYATRFINADANMANLYNTCTTGIALTYYCEKTGKHHDILSKIYNDTCRTFEYIKEDRKGFFIYYPSQKHPTYNVNALALFMFSRINQVSKKDIVPLDQIKEILTLIISEQLPDGSWFYSRSSKGKWVDGFHSGFIIESLLYVYQNGYKLPELKLCIDKAIEYYLSKMFTSDIYPKYFDYSGKYPVESQNCAQAIQTLVAIVEYGRKEAGPMLDSLLNNVIASLYSSNGYFYYKKQANFTNKASYLRWSTTPMLVGLMYAYILKEKNE